MGNGKWEMGRYMLKRMVQVDNLTQARYKRLSQEFKRIYSANFGKFRCPLPVRSCYGPRGLKVTPVDHYEPHTPSVGWYGLGKDIYAEDIA
jgi:hypothetical protein